MSSTIDNLIALKVLYMLVTPFEKTNAYRLGIIDKNGEPLKKLKDLKNSDEKDAYTALDRLVFNLKKLIEKLPGGKSTVSSILAAYWLVKENSDKSHITEKEFFNLVNLLEEKKIILVEEYLELEEFAELYEEITNVTGPAVSTDYPTIKSKRKSGVFDVSDHVFRRFEKGKKKFARWNKYLNMEDEVESSIYDFAMRNPSGIIVLKNNDNLKAIRFNRSGGGNWRGIGRNVVTTEELG